MEINEEKLKKLIVYLDCGCCPLKGAQFRCSHFVGTLNPMGCDEVILKWLHDETIPPYWDDAQYQRAIERS